MNIYKGDDDWKRVITDACNIIKYGTFEERDELYAITHSSNISYYGRVTSWGTFWDEHEWLPGDWKQRIPFVMKDGTHDAMIIKFARHQPDREKLAPECTKALCYEGKCSGKEWCTCHCDHWWMP
tara:strand:+ start:1220 stop:1594 length:375 start_codon:yes stop_codon:yes gene_type:complete